MLQRCDFPIVNDYFSTSGRTRTVKIGIEGLRYIHLTTEAYTKKPLLKPTRVRVAGVAMLF